MLQTRTIAATQCDTIGGTEGFHGAPSACSNGCRFFQKCGASPAPPERNGPLIRLARRQTVYSEGDEARFSYKVVEGAVRISRILSDGHRQILDFLLPGDTLGIETADAYAASAETIGESVLLRCPRACVEKRSEVNHSREMLAMLSRSLCSAQDHIVLLGHQCAGQRVATFLLKLARAATDHACEVIELPIGRQDMADYLGLTIETTCRTLSDLKSKQIITIPSRHQIVLRNRERLVAIAEGDS